MMTVSTQISVELEGKTFFFFVAVVILSLEPSPLFQMVTPPTGTLLVLPLELTKADSW